MKAKRVKIKINNNCGTAIWYHHLIGQELIVTDRDGANYFTDDGQAIFKRDADLVEMPMSEEEKIAMLDLAIKIEPLIKFGAALIPDIPLLEKCVDEIGERESFTRSAAPILGAMGMDAEAKKVEWELRRKRIEALLEFVKVMDLTEKEKAAFIEKKESISADMRLLQQYLR